MSVQYSKRGIVEIDDVKGAIKQNLWREVSKRVPKKKQEVKEEKEEKPKEEEQQKDPSSEE